MIVSHKDIPGTEIHMDERRTIWRRQLLPHLLPTYLHNAWKPVQSLLDTVMVGAALFAGLTTANLYTPITAAYYSTTWTTLLIFAVTPSSFFQS